MIFSMTGYATATRDVRARARGGSVGDGADEPAAASVSVDLRSVNSRFLDLHFRMPEELRAAEPPLREALNARLGRGKVEIRINLQNRETTTLGAINPEALDELAALSQQVSAVFPAAGALRVADILRWPGVLAQTTIDPADLRAAVLAAGEEALAALVESRQREGAQLRTMLVERIAQMEAIIADVTPMVPELLAKQQQKIVERLREALDATGSGGATLSREEVDDRIRQEVTVYGIRIDVAEELSRLSAHLIETRRVLEAGGRVGKRLDFLMQELNREANTLGSKAAARELADASMALKLLIEQMREQVQNLE
ncbi:YicC/YloC family endoribonuclease [Chitinasiproducens palmae]|uniref:TIGR00255 family protein n=1 Tax=Chitinasiproducens palmae TaxID=1770053 RepID=A0A1H2PVY6_9BURK|nr:YicC/YloC family endoribonuclease [Chitinasiproducens palmae]SDV51127.1 TIGR00255 family protein [Chitinasiproducens palmae]